MKSVKFRFAAILLVAIMLLVGCTAAPTPTPTPSPTSSVASVSLSNFSFSPATITVKTGTTVTWTNRDAADHTVTSDTNLFNSGGLTRNATFSYTFTSRGSFPYHCSYHPSMLGTIIVE